MGNASAKETTVQSEPNISPANPVSGGEKKLKPCCACPETKRARDDCIINNGQESCAPQIEAHKQCMRKMGFNI